MFCPHCGKQINDGSKSCIHCNKSIDQEYVAPVGMQGAQVNREFSLEKEMSFEEIKKESKISEKIQEPVKSSASTLKNPSKLPILLSAVIMLFAGLMVFFLNNNTNKEISNSEKQEVRGGSLGSFYVGSIKVKLKDGYTLRCSTRIEYDKNSTEYSDLSGERSRIKEVFTSVLAEYTRSDIGRYGLSKEIVSRAVKKISAVVGEGKVISIKLNAIRFTKGNGTQSNDDVEQEEETSDSE